ncbi:MAG: hypothetical protein NTY13_04975 [Chlamydiae bacterium]|nr:hypothetical protein [Chlamydiota bacterium]
MIISAYFIRRNAALYVGGFYPCLQFEEDYDLWLKLSYMFFKKQEELPDRLRDDKLSGNYASVGPAIL